MSNGRIIITDILSIAAVLKIYLVVLTEKKYIVVVLRNLPTLCLYNKNSAISVFLFFFFFLLWNEFFAFFTVC